MLMRYLPIVLAVACVMTLLLLYERMQPASTAPAEPQTHQIALQLVDGHRHMGPAEIDAYVGDRLLLTVSTAQPVEVHLHGYERRLNPTPEHPTTLDLTLVHSGRFELEAHPAIDGHGNLTVINVNPR